MTKLLKTLLIAAALVLPAVAATAQPAPVRLSPADQTAIARIEDYLNGIRTMQARFTQVSDTGGFAEGDFYLSRPGRMRVEYDTLPYLYVADGTWLTYYDRELGQRSDVLLGSTLADFITRRNVRLSGDVIVTGLRRNAQSTEVDLVQADDPGQGSLTLVFDSDPLRLRRWVVTDAQNIRTEVALSDVRTDVQLRNNLFSVPRR